MHVSGTVDETATYRRSCGIQLDQEYRLGWYRQR